MLGLSDLQEIKGDTIQWADASLGRIEITFDQVTLLVREESKSLKVLRCHGYIGFECVGFWDEVVIEKAVIYSGHDFIERCERRVHGLPRSGAERCASGNKLLEVVFNCTGAGACVRPVRTGNAVQHQVQATDHASRRPNQ
jgi:hypothetical protein